MMTISDGLKGSAFPPQTKGFINGAFQEETAIKKGIVGGIDYSNIITTYGNVEPVQIVNYAESHNNNTLWDKLLLTNPKDSDEIRTKMAQTRRFYDSYFTRYSILPSWSGIFKN